ncbi:amidohydrolase [Paracoccus sp. Z118]|uniref:amidohydrolase n=1 Tax=Paracoccus sp. Z118 TaxID=2851017 RepID=UPI001C2CA971|nr:amidohydrolase [Paracoccus sp. Z118]MBV0890937.1 amidohydrolase [Paracoccus sp. Z118]
MEAADVVLTGGVVWCGLDLPQAEAVAIRDGRVVATGTTAEIEAMAGPQTQRIDLKGRFAMPGINDAHMHLLPLGLEMARVDLRPDVAPTLQSLLDALRAKAAVTPKGEWVRGRGFNHFLLDVGRFPHRDELDAACPDHPCYIVRTDGHSAVANSRALALAGVDESTPQPEGGLIEMKDGRLTGMVAETGREPFEAVMPHSSVDEMVEAIEAAGKTLLGYGITSVMEAAIGLHDGWDEMVAYRRARDEGRLPLRVYGCVMADKTKSILPQAMAEGLATGQGCEMFRIGPVKMFTDGSAGSKTAAMTQDYMGDPGNKGLLCIPDQSELDAMVKEAHDAGWQMGIHAIGDAAIEEVLNAIEAAQAANPAKDRRHRIEHCGWLRPDQMDRMQRLGVLPASQASFLYWFGDNYDTVLEADRIAASHPFRTWTERGMNPSASTDCPVTEIDPRPVIYNLVTRKTKDGKVFGPEQRLTIDEALHAYTSASAFASGEEDIKGRLVPGHLADIAVFDRDLTAVEPDALLDAVCEMTLRGGEVVHEARGPA